MSKVQVYVKSPDVIHEITYAQAEGDSNAADEKREWFSDEYFEFGDYLMIEIDTKTLACRLLKRKEWKR